MSNKLKKCEHRVIEPSNADMAILPEVVRDYILYLQNELNTRTDAMDHKQDKLVPFSESEFYKLIIQKKTMTIIHKVSKADGTFLHAYESSVRELVNLFLSTFGVPSRNVPSVPTVEEIKKSIKGWYYQDKCFDWADDSDDLISDLAQQIHKLVKERTNE